MKLPARILTLLCCAMFSTFLSAQNVANPQQLLTQARATYYSLSVQGMAGFECSATPNWEKMLQEQRAQNPAAADRAIQVLNQIHFVVKVMDGKLKLTHADIPGQSEQMNAALAQIYSGMDQMTSGFFDTWSLFMINSPFPAVDSKYQMQAGGPVYLLTYTEAGSDVATTMGKDFAISELKVKSSEFDSAIHPQFTKTPQGFVLSSYTASYASKNPGEATQLAVFLDYQELERLQMLNKLNLSGTYGGAPFAVELAFSNCQVSRKTSVN